MTEHEPKPLDPSKQLLESAKAASKRMYLQNADDLSSDAIRSQYPNLVRLAHFEDHKIHDPEKDTVQTMAGFSLWTLKHHVLTADGRIAWDQKNSEVEVPDEYTGLIVVNDSELKHEHPYIFQELEKAIATIATTAYVRSERGQWVAQPVSLDYLRQNSNHQDS